MNVQLPREIQVIDLWPASIRFVLPRRDLGRGKFIGWLLLMLGLVAMSTAVYWALATWGGVPWELPNFLRAPAFFLSLATLGGLIPLWWGLAALFGHREIEIRGDSIRTFERVGPLWRSKRWKLDKVARFDCVDPSGDSDGNIPGHLARFYALLLRKSDGGQGMLAWGYAPELLRPLGEALTERGNAALERSGQTPSIGPAGKVAGEEDFDEDEDLDDEDGEAKDSDWSDAAADDAPDLEPSLTQPAGSQIAVDKFEGGLTIRVPPAGVWKGSSGMFLFALLWNGFMTVFTSAAICGGLNAENPPDETALWVFPLVISLFWAVGIGMLLGSLNMGRRRAMFAIAAGKLLVMQQGIFGARQREWAVEEIDDITTGPSGMKVNDREVPQLQIKSSSGEKLGLLTGRDSQELEWLACELRGAWRAARSTSQPHAPSLKPPESS
jgi:hypothetical protein